MGYGTHNPEVAGSNPAPATKRQGPAGGDAGRALSSFVAAPETADAVTGHADHPARSGHDTSVRVVRQAGNEHVPAEA